MEPQPNSPEDSEEKSKKLSRRAREFLQGWLTRREEPVDQDSEVEHEKTVERKEKKTRRQRMQESLSEFFHLKVDKPDPIKEPSPSEAPTASVMFTPEAPEPEAVEAVVPLVPPPAGPPPITPIEGGGPSPAERAAAEHFVAPFHSREAATPPTHTVERVIERPRGAGAVAALLGLEYLARRRADRKVRKDFNKQLNKQQKETKTAINTVDQRVQTSERENQTIKQIIERPLPPQPHIEQAQVKVIERTIVQEKPVTLPEQAPQRLPQPEILATPRPNEEPTPEKVAEKIVQQTERVKRPEEVQEKVKAAAERNLPVESIYERRHEVKKPTARAVAGGVAGAPSGGLTPIGQSLPALSGMPASYVSPNSSSGTDSPDLYKQAVKSGLWGAVVVLILISIVFIVINR